MRYSRREMLDAMLALNAAIAERSVITAIQHFAKAGDKHKLMRARKQVAKILSNEALEDQINGGSNVR